MSFLLYKRTEKYEHLKVCYSRLDFLWINTTFSLHSVFYEIGKDIVSSYYILLEQSNYFLKFMFSVKGDGNEQILPIDLIGILFNKYLQQIPGTIVSIDFACSTTIWYFFFLTIFQSNN